MANAKKQQISIMKKKDTNGEIQNAKRYRWFGRSKSRLVQRTLSDAYVTRGLGTLWGCNQSLSRTVTDKF